MKKIKYTAIILLHGYFLNAQVIQTGKTDNAIVVKNTNIGFNIGESEVNVGFTNYFKPVVKPKGWIWGVNAKAKNANGLAAWFQSGDFQPAASANGIFGFYYSNVTDTLPQTYYEPADLLKEYDKIKDQIRTDFLLMIKKPYYGFSSAEQKTEILYVNEQLANNISTFHALRDDLLDKINDPTGIDAQDSLHREMYQYLVAGPVTKRIADFYEYQTLLSDYTSNISNLLSKRKFYTVKVFGTFGISGEQFSLFNGWNSNNLAQSFTTENFRGGNIGGGVNFSWRGKWMLGIMDRYEESNNTDLLSSQKYSLSNTLTLGTQTAKTANDVTAYDAKDYSRVYFNNLYIDLLHYFPLKADSAMIIADLYFRHKSSNNEIIYANNSTIGVSAGLFKNSGIFMGGLYLELPDINEKLAKMDPDYTSRKWYRRMSFGVYGKIAFSSLLHAL